MAMLSLISLSFICIHSQPDSLGYISIDCGYTTSPTYTDGKTGLTYVADGGFIDAGSTHTVHLGNMQPDLAQRYSTVRFFPNGARNCYTLRSLTPGGKYFLRSVFGYGNYDSLNMPPAFDLYLGVNYWTTVTITNGSRAYVFDTIAVSPAERLQVCLVNIGLGTPFISGLDLRSLPPNLYPEANVTQSLVLLSFFRDTVGFGFNRYHFGTDDHHIRYPDDRYDRMWQKYEDNPSWIDIPDKVNGEVQNSPNDTYNAPSAVMRSASTPANTSRMDLSWSSDASMNVGVDAKYFLVLYFAEVEAIRDNALRQFHVFVDNTPLAAAFSPEYMLATVLSGTVQGSAQHVINLVATSTSKLPPLISAMEIYLLRPLNESATDSSDANAMMTIQTKFSVKRNWEGDPCAPIAFEWDGLNCSRTTSGPHRIIALNLSFSGLVGEIDASFGQLTMLQHLDLSHNNLSGSIPDFLGHMPSLTFLDLSSNNLSGTIPISLLEKSQDEVLTLRISNNPNLCGYETCDPIPNQKKNKTKLTIEIVVPVVATIALLLALLVIWHRRSCDRQPPTAEEAADPTTASTAGSAITQTCGYQTCDPIPNQKNKTKLIIEIVVPVVATIALLFVALLVIWHRRKKRRDVTHEANSFENRRFKYKELKVITNGFKNIIGKGGFGLVYIGYLENRTAVAVKVQSQTSSQGSEEFLAEARHLTRVHHRNLVSLIGYCKDKKNLCLVYEYMEGGNLEDRLRGREAPPTEPLTWLQRLNIALGSANGLEYLHKSCSPPLIHRDVKTRNILLNANLEAKVSDFGLTRAFSSETRTHTNTQPAGTIGYLDPEYLATSRLSEKSDVYSFGVVLLVLITAQPAIITINSTQSTNVVRWVRERLSEEDIENVADPRIIGDCDVNSVWKVAELALRCTEHAGQDRPTMTEVVEGLRESLQLETSSRSMRRISIGTSGLAYADAESVGVLEAEQIGETSAR